MSIVGAILSSGTRASSEYDEEDGDSISRSTEKRRRRQLSSSANNNQINPDAGEVFMLANPQCFIDTAFLPVKNYAEASRTHSISRKTITCMVFDFKRRITNLYVSFSSLQSYVEANYSGSCNIIKMQGSNSTPSTVGLNICTTNTINSPFSESTYLAQESFFHDVLEQTVPFLPNSKDRHDEAADQFVGLYTQCVARGHRRFAKQKLKPLERENIAWERDTVWRQMIDRERRGEGAPLTLVKQPQPGLFAIPAPFGCLTIPRKKQLLFCGTDTLRTALGSETILLFVTFILVPLLRVCLQVVRDPTPESEHLRVPDATEFIFSAKFSQTIMLLIGGFTISSALSTTSIDRIIITRVLSLAGTRPSVVLLAFMCVLFFASMWISNVAAPTLCFALIRPILRTLPPKTSFPPALILGIALAANIGGQSSRISPPQTLIALQNMDDPLARGR
ncbi:hypothetical protein J3R30DRAFT_3724981 [Lentinula aciculospora]|uniref:Citrate transporter-like domain-containing protein n=1 Tax=Lentinula aciculospora TaxID=153920 RepID=A0A9W8ZRJ9_9AGAR|nr:hypothetical protein J3R30DRAFT_3724981 [Lentinula aciculospora]